MSQNIFFIKSVQLYFIGFSVSIGKTSHDELGFLAKSPYKNYPSQCFISCKNNGDTTFMTAESKVARDWNIKT